VYRYELATGARVESALHRGAVMTGLPLGDGVFLDGSSERLSVWLPDLGVGASVDTVPTSLVDLQRSPSGRRVLSSGTDMAFYVWDLATGERRVLRGHDGSFPAARWAGDDQVITSTSDGTVRLWTLPPLAPLDPGATRAWLDTLTSFELGDLARREPACR
jgi:WD40 repeat protein